MSSFVLKHGKTIKVKNLGWMLRNWRNIETIGFNYSPENTCDGELFAKMKNGDCYFSNFASLSVCWNWLDKPIFRGLKFSFGWAEGTQPHLEDKTKNYIIGDSEWKKINLLFNKLNGNPVYLINSFCEKARKQGLTEQFIRKVVNEYEVLNSDSKIEKLDWLIENLKYLI